MNFFDRVKAQIFKGVEHLAANFDCAVQGVHRDVDSYMAVAEQSLTLVEAEKIDPSLAGSVLTAYDLIKRQLLLGDSNRFLVVSGALTGIQDFLFDTTSSGALKRLRGRSFYLSLLIDAVVEALLGEFNLSRQSLLYNSGGTFCMIVPNVDGVEARFDDFARRVKTLIFNQYGKQMVLLNALPASRAEVEHNLSDILARLQQLKVRDKHTPLAAKLGEAEFCSTFFAPQSAVDSQEFGVTLMESIGSNLGKTKYLFVTRGVSLPNSAMVTITPIEGIGVKYAMLDKFDNEFDYSDGTLICYNSTPLPKGIACRREYIAGIGSHTRTFEELNASWIAVLRMDVDNLGVTMRNSFAGKYPLAGYANMSRQLDIYFKRRLNDMWLSGGYDRSIVIVYSGGDDLFLVGEWSKVIEFAQLINEQSRVFFAKNPITISAGIAITDMKYPLLRAAEMGASEESLAKRFTYKGSSKNAISIFGVPMRWDVEFKQVMSLSDRLNTLRNENAKLINPILRRVLSYSEMASFENGEITPVRLIWLVTYDLSRSKNRNRNYKELGELIDMCKLDITVGNTIWGAKVDMPYHSLQMWSIAARLVEIKNRNI